MTYLTARHLCAMAAMGGCGRDWPPWPGLSPLLWQQAVITEVYALHALLVALLGWAVLVHPDKLWYVVMLVALGMANHLTFVLLLPAAFYIIWAQRIGCQNISNGVRRARLRHVLPIAAIWAGLCLARAYVRMPLAAAKAPPVNWGYADNWQASGGW